MTGTFKNITDAFRKLGITEEIIFTGSAVLKMYNLLDRKITDIDIILRDSSTNRIIINALKSIFGTKGTISNYTESHIELFYQDNLHLDIFLKEDVDIEVFGTSYDFFVATPKHIIRKKLSYGRGKDIKDWNEIQLNMLDEMIAHIGKR